jgi:predicted aminopeptidase
MIKLRFFIFIGLLLFCITVLHARGNREETPARADADRHVENSRLVQITGVVRLVGSGLFNELVISSPEAEYYIARDDRFMLHDLQHRTVTVEGEETLTELMFAGGQSAGTRRELRNIRIITVH